MYQPENIPIFEASYGKGLISLGGYNAVKRMFENVPLKGKVVLDIGSGIGGMAHFLAKTYQAKVIGLEILPWMVEYAKKTTPLETRGDEKFLWYSGSAPFPLEEHSIDIVCSKGVLTNISDKNSLLKEVHRILKISGSIVFIDWLITDPTKKAEILPFGEPSYKETETSYKDILEKTGFDTILLKDVTDEYLQYVRELGNTLNSKEHKKVYAAIISDQLRMQLIMANDHLLNQIITGKQKSFLISAKSFMPGTQI